MGGLRSRPCDEGLRVVQGLPLDNCIPLDELEEEQPDSSKLGSSGEATFEEPTSGSDQHMTCCLHPPRFTCCFSLKLCLNVDLHLSSDGVTFTRHEHEKKALDSHGPVEPSLGSDSIHPDSRNNACSDHHHDSSSWVGGRTDGFQTEERLP